MTRIGTKWITMVIVLVLAAGAWAQRERKDDHKRSDRRSETRSMADEYRGDGERQEREKQNRDEQRRGKPDVRIFRFEHIPAESFMEVIGQLSRRGPLGEILSKIPIALHQHSNAVVIIGPPKAMELFERLADGLDAPSAFHERMAQGKKPGAPKKFDAHKKPGAPKKFDAHKKPGAPKKFDAHKKPGASKKFDAPKKFDASKKPGASKKFDAHKKPDSPKKPGASKKFDAHKKPDSPKKFDAHKKPGQKEPTSPKHPTPGKSPGGINEEAIIKAMGNPVGELFGKILSEPAARELRLENPQREAMHKIAQQCGQKVGHMRQRVIQAIRGMSHEQRSANARKIVGNAREAMGEMAGEARKHIFGILKPEQRKAAARLLGAPGPVGNKGAKPSSGGTCPKSKTGAKGKPTPSAVPGEPRPIAAPSGCGGCGSRGIVLGDTGNCKTSDF